MNHLMKHRKLNRTSTHRKAMFKNLSVSLLTHEQITTTLPKAKELKRVVEKLITMGKKNSLAIRRMLLSKLNNNNFVVEKILTNLSLRYKERAGGYTRVMKANFRFGDMAPMAIIELVDRNINAKGQELVSTKSGII